MIKTLEKDNVGEDIIEKLNEKEFFKEVEKQLETDIIKEKPTKEQLEFVKFEKKLGDVEHSQPRILISNTTFKKVKILHSGYRIDGDDDDDYKLL